MKTGFAAVALHCLATMRRKAALHCLSPKQFAHLRNPSLLCFTAVVECAEFSCMAAFPQPPLPPTHLQAKKRKDGELKINAQGGRGQQAWPAYMYVPTQAHAHVVSLPVGLAAPEVKLREHRLESDSFRIKHNGHHRGIRAYLLYALAGKLKQPHNKVTIANRP